MNLNQTRWKLCEDGGIAWNIQNSVLPHQDHLEMSGEYVSLHIRYHVSENREVKVEQTLVWPWLRMIPNDTHASMKSVQKEKQVNPVIFINEQAVALQGTGIIFDGILKIYENYKESLQVIRSYYPSMDKKGTFLKIEFENIAKEPYQCAMAFEKEYGTQRGGQGIYVHESKCGQKQSFRLNVNEKKVIYISFSSRFLYDEEEALFGEKEEEKRKLFLGQTKEMLKLETENELINQAFEFAKIRSTESIFRTKSGLLHSPGGLHYYGGIWANDQAEYANPFFAFTDRKNPVESAINCYRMFRNFMGPAMECIPSSIIAEGLDIWEGKGDRGDTAMYAYGLSRFLLTLGDPDLAGQYFDSLVWSLEYCEKQKNEDGVICSDSDELEGRFPSGNTNLTTSCLVYEALRATAILAQELSKAELAAQYESRRMKLGEAIEAYFGRNIAGFETYRYCEADEKLRAWICIPLTMGILNRKKETVRALISKQLWTADGLLTMEGEATYWDRATLYALRGIFAAGDGDTALKYLIEYSQRRVLGEHVPYPVEAYPEGDGRHLSAESALYARIFMEGLFGMKPSGLKEFICCPSLPADWSKISLKNIQYGGEIFDLTVKQNADGDQYKITIRKSNKIDDFIIKRGKEVKININF